jgi:oxygen-independent coproporphyrinogen III oxidase
MHGEAASLEHGSTAWSRPPVLSEAMLARLDTAGPRYTSYPTADRFVEGFGPEDYGAALRQRAEGAAGPSAPPLSVYVHVPFCESVCYYCACNKVVTKDRSRAVPYLHALEREVTLHTDVLGTSQPMSQLHFGGGTPTYLSDAQLEHVVGVLSRAFRPTPAAEVSIEVDPRTASPRRLELLRALGFNRISFGVQDFDADVQVTVHRIQPYGQVEELMQAARELGFESINADLIYGLPKQTPASFSRTIERIVELRPDRIALYAYAHLPQRFKPQRRILTPELPTPQQRVSMLGAALGGLTSQGYAYIGMDHFALPQDALAVAKREGRLHRNFQGYSTQPDCDLIGLGVSAIGRVGATYSQNAKTLPEYEAALEQDRFATVRGLGLTRDDALRRDVIMALMCQGAVSFAPIEAAHGISFAETFVPELDELRAMVEMGLVEVKARSIEVTPLGWYFVRAIAMVFDRHLRGDRMRERFSRIV